MKRMTFNLILQKENVMLWGTFVCILSDEYIGNIAVNTVAAELVCYLTYHFPALCHFILQEVQQCSLHSQTRRYFNNYVLKLPA